MSLDQDFELPEEDNQPADEADGKGEEPQPLVVIQYRNRGLPPFLIPPLLVVVAAGLIMSYQRQTPPRSMTAPPGRARTVAAELPSPAPPAAKRVAAGADSKPAPGPTAKAAPEPPEPETEKEPAAPAPPAEEVAAAPAPAPPSGPAPEEGVKKTEAASDVTAEAPPGPAARPEPAQPDPEKPREVASAEKPAPRPAIGFTPPADDPAPPEPPQQQAPEAVAEQIEQEVQQEAAQKAAERQELESVKREAKLREIKEAIERAEEMRIPFRNDLREILRAEPPGKAGLLIDELCNQYGRDTLPQIRDAVKRAWNKMKGRYGHRQMVEMMRFYGLPEPMILDFLAHDIHQRRINSRGGPRNEREVRLSAARALLTYSVAPARTDPSGRSMAGAAPARGPVRGPQ